MQRLLVLALFLLSGAAGLVYQVVWTRELTLVVGVTSQAVSTVLAVFMGGLALGSWLLGRAGDESRSPLRVYGWLELGIAAFGFQSALIFGGLTELYVDLRRGGAVPEALFPLARLALACLALLGPTALMGATLPILIKGVSSSLASLGRDTGRLYAVNTLGAVLGTLATAFFLIEAFGLRATSWVAASTNLLVGLAALALARRMPAAAPEPGRSLAPPPAAPPYVASHASADGRLRRAVLLAFGASGFLALAYEVLWTRYLIYVVGENSVYAFSSMLAAFLIGIALGSFLASLVADRVRRLDLLLGAVIVLVGASALVTVALMTPLVTHRRWGGTGSFWIESAKGFVKCLAVLIVPTTLSGSTFALVARLYARDPATLGRDTGRAYAVNTLGAILGAVAGGFLVLPLLGLRAGLIVLAALNVLVGLALLLRDSPAGRGKRTAAVTAGLALAAALSVLVAGRPEEVALPRGDERVVFYADGPESSVAVLEGAGSGNLSLKVDGDGQAGTWSRYQLHLRLLGHLGPLFHPQPRTGLVVAYGAGITTGSLLQHPLERVDLVELSREVLEAAPLFAPHNHDPLNDPRLVLVRDDGRNFLLRSERSYDVITSDPIDPDDRGVTSLYSKEYYELVRSRLAPGGVATQWMTSRYDPEEYALLVRTFQSVFPYTSIWFADFTTVLVGLRDEPRVDMDSIRRRLADPRVAASLAEIGVAAPEHLLALHLAGPEGVRAFAGSGPPYNTDDRPRIEYSGPRWSGPGLALRIRERLWMPLLEHRRSDLSGWIAGWTSADTALVEGQARWMDELYARFVLPARDLEPAARNGNGGADDPALADLLRRAARSRVYLDHTWNLIAAPTSRLVHIMAGLERPDPPAALAGEALERYRARMGVAEGLWSSGAFAAARAELDAAAQEAPDALRPRLLAAACAQREGRILEALDRLLALDTAREDHRALVHLWPARMLELVLEEMVRAPERAAELGAALLERTPPDEQRPRRRSWRDLLREPPPRARRPIADRTGDALAWAAYWEDAAGELAARDGRFVWK